MFRGHLRRSVEFSFLQWSSFVYLMHGDAHACRWGTQYTVLPMFTRYSTDLQVVATHQEMAAMCQQRPGRSYKLLVYKDVNNAGFKKYWKNRLCKCFTWKEIHWTRRIHNVFWWETFTVNNFLFLFTRKLHSAPFKRENGKKKLAFTDLNCDRLLQLK